MKPVIFIRICCRNFLLEVDQAVNGYRHLVLTADHLLSSIYSKEQLGALGSGYQAMESTLLDVEVLHSLLIRKPAGWALLVCTGCAAGCHPRRYHDRDPGLQPVRV
jgi:hypothetical protein